MDPTPNTLERELELARAAYTPRAELRERVLDRILSASPSADGAPPAPRDTSEAVAVQRRGLRAAGTKALMAVGLVSLGFVAGWEANGARSEAPPPLPAAPRAVAPDPILLPEPPALPANEAAGSVTAPLADEARARPSWGHAPRANTARTARRPRMTTPDTPPARSPEAPAPEPANHSAREELALLQRAERAVRAGNSALGLALIGELEVKYPRSRLLEERRAVELMAHCTVGATDSRARAERFLREQPRSIYAARIGELCSVSSTPSQR
jgi:hypothetical protein